MEGTNGRIPISQAQSPQTQSTLIEKETPTSNQQLVTATRINEKVNELSDSSPSNTPVMQRSSRSSFSCVNSPRNFSPSREQVLQEINKPPQFNTSAQYLHFSEAYIGHAAGEFAAQDLALEQPFTQSHSIGHTGGESSQTLFEDHHAFLGVNSGTCLQHQLLGLTSDQSLNSTAQATTSMSALEPMESSTQATASLTELEAMESLQLEPFPQELEFEYDWNALEMIEDQATQLSPEELSQFAPEVPIDPNHYLEAATRCLEEISSGNLDNDAIEQKKTTANTLFTLAAGGLSEVGDIAGAFAARSVAAKLTIPGPQSSLYTMDANVIRGQALQSNPLLPANFSDVGAGSIKQNALNAYHRNVDGQEQLWIHFELSKFARRELHTNLNHILSHQELFTASLPREMRGRVSIKEVDDAFIGRKGAEVDSPFTTDPNFAYLPKDFTGENAKAIEIAIAGAGTIVIGNSPLVGNLYNNVRVILEANQEDGQALKQLHQLTTMLGIGPVANQTRTSDTERLKAAFIFRTHCPATAAKMERTKAFYHLPVETLKAKMIEAEPQMQTIFAKYDSQPQLIAQKEGLPGKVNLEITDLAQQVPLHGLFIGVGGGSMMPGDEVGAATARKNAQEVVKMLSCDCTSSLMRFQAGIFNPNNLKGASNRRDLCSGGASKVFTRGHNENCSENHCREFTYGGMYQICIDKEVLNRGSVFYENDKYGASNPLDEYGEAYENRSNIFEGAQNLATKSKNLVDMEDDFRQGKISEEDLEEYKKMELQMPEHMKRKGIANEILIKDSIPSSYVKHVVCQSLNDKKILMEEMRNAGLLRKEGRFFSKKETFNGIPVEEFVIVADNFNANHWK